MPSLVDCIKRASKVVDPEDQTALLGGKPLAEMIQENAATLDGLRAQLTEAGFDVTQQEQRADADGVRYNQEALPQEEMKDAGIEAANQSEAVLPGDHRLDPTRTAGEEAAEQITSLEQNRVPEQQIITIKEAQDWLEANGYPRVAPKGGADKVIKKLMKDPSFQDLVVFDRIRIVAQVERTMRNRDYSSRANPSKNAKLAGGDSIRSGNNQKIGDAEILAADTVRGCDHYCYDCFGLRGARGVNHQHPVVAPLKGTLKTGETLRIGEIGDPSKNWAHTSVEVKKLIERSRKRGADVNAAEHVFFTTKLLNLNGIDKDVIRNLQVTLDPMYPAHMATSMRNILRLKAAHPESNIVVRVRSMDSKNPDLQASQQAAVDFANEFSIPVLETRLRFRRKDAIDLLELNEDNYEYDKQLKLKKNMLSEESDTHKLCGEGGLGCPTCLNCVNKGKGVSHHPVGSAEKQSQALRDAGVEPVDLPNDPTFDPVGGSTYYQAQGKIRGAAIILDSGKKIIQLTKDQNRSTFLHETFHVYETMLDSLVSEDLATEEMLKDYQILRDFGEGLSEQDAKEKRARAFEKYLMEGKAPSARLAQTFAAIKDWLLDIYRSLARLDVEMTDEIRGFFDRALASEQEIADASMLYDKAETLLDLFEVEQKRKDKVNQKTKMAKEKAEAQQRADRIERADLTDEERAEVRKQAEQEIEESPTYVALDIVRKTPLDSNEVRQQLGTDQTAELSKRRMVTPGGLSLLELAAEAGFDSTSAALEAIVEAGPKEVAIQNREQEILVERESGQNDETPHGSENYHNEDVSKALLSRLEELQRLIKRKSKTPTSRIDYVAARIAAQDLLSRQTVTNAANYYKFAQAEMTYSRKAMEAGRRYQAAIDKTKGKKKEAKAAQAEVDPAIIESLAREERAESRTTKANVASYEAGVRIAGRKLDAAESAEGATQTAEQAQQEALLEAEKYTRLQLLNHIMATQAVKAREYRDKSITRMGKIKNKRLGTITGDYHEAIRHTMQNMGLSEKGALRPDVMKYQELLDELEFGPAPYPVPGFIRGETKAKYQDLTFGQFEDLITFLQVLEARGRNIVKLGAEGEQQTVQEKVEASVMPMQNRKGVKVPNKQKSFFEARKYMDQVLAETMHVQFDFKRADGYTNFGKNAIMGENEQMFDKVFQARNAMTAAYTAFNTEFLESIGKRITDLNDRFATQFGSKPAQVDGVPLPIALQLGTQVAYEGWTAEMALAVALNLGNKGNLDAVTEGLGLTFDDIQTLLSQVFVKEDLQLVQDIWDAIDTLFKPMDDAHNRLNGYRLKKVDAQQFDVDLGNGETFKLKGGYYPLSFDPELSRKVAGFSEQDLLKQDQVNVHHRNKPREGFTKERTGGKYPVSLSVQPLFRHVNDTIRYTHLAETLTDVHKVIKTDEYAEAYSRLLGAERYNTLIPWLSNVASPGTRGADALDRFMQRYQRLTGIFVFAGNLASGIKQTLSLTSAAQEMGWSNVAVGMAMVLKNPLKAVRDVEGMSVPMKGRAGKIEHEVARQIERHNPFEKGITIAGKRLTLKDIQDLAFTFIRMGDILGAYPTWLGRYHQMLDSGKTHNQAVMEADRLVTQTQPMTNEVFKNLWQSGGPRSGSAGRLLRWAVSPFTGWTMLFGSRSRAYYAGWREGEISTKDFAMHVFNERLLSPILATAITLGFADREEEEPWKAYMWDLLGYNLSWLPFVNTLPRMGRYGTYGGVTELPTAKPLKNIAKTAGTTWAFMATDEKGFSDLIKVYAGLAEFETGVPLLNAYKNIRKIANVVDKGENE